MIINERKRNRNRSRNPQQQNQQPRARKKHYLLSWSKPHGNGVMGCIVDGNGTLIETINSLFFKGNPSQDFNRKCKTYNIQGKMSGNEVDQFVLKGNFTSPRQAIEIFKKEIIHHLNVAK